MHSARRTITVRPASEIAELLDEAAEGPLVLEKDGMRFHLVRDDQDLWAGYDAERARAGMRAAAGTWTSLDAEALKADIYRAREEGTRPPDRP